MKNFDAIIIGSGQAGNPLAHNLADSGWTVALIEKEYMGGSCVNYGCTPTKTMVASSQAAFNAGNASQLGIEIADVKVNLKKVVERKNKMVHQWRGGQEKQAAKRSNITVFNGSAQFTGSHVITVNGEELKSKNIFINTGTSPLILPIEGINEVNYLTNRNIMDLEEVPEHLLVIGGSYVGLEFGQMFKRFGSKVTIIERKDQIISKEDKDVSESLQEALEDEGIQFIKSAQAVSIRKDANGGLHLTVKLNNNKEEVIKGSHILLAVGRKPNTDGLGLDAVGIETYKGYITVDEYLRTNIPGVYALGDVKGGPAFTHISYNDFQIVYHNLFNDEKKSIKDRIVPYTLFTDPELGRVGLTEKEARESGYNVMVGKIPMSHVARAIEMGVTKGLMKIVVDADTDQILGATVLGINGGEVVQTIMVLMYAKVRWKLLKGAVYIHPTLTEGFFGLLESVK
ncbi:MAG: dihydrolipoyl dehydrogenase [Bacteroidetes bacterium]|nr:dihydrolipoyl dehydrogenase [Bacteroidota bacterium]